MRPPESCRRRIGHTGTMIRGPEPLCTWYDVGHDARAELSATTMANWYSKTCHLFSDHPEADVDDESLIVLSGSPHWLWPVWAWAAWELDATVGAAAHHGDLGCNRQFRNVVVLVDEAAASAFPDQANPSDMAASTWVRSDSPWALPTAASARHGACDFFEEVRGQPDHWPGRPAHAGPQLPPDGSLPVLSRAESESWAEQIAHESEISAGSRVALWIPGDDDHAARESAADQQGWPTAPALAALCLWPLVIDVSVVLVVGGTADNFRKVLATERATHAVVEANC